MKVAISVPGRFHLFDLAQQLLKRDYLSQLITSYPKFEVKKYGIPSNLIRSVISKEVLFRGWERMPIWIRKIFNPQYFIHNFFDILAASSLKKSDIAVGGSSVFLHTLSRAKKFGAVTVVERGSSHITYQNKILREEYELCGIELPPMSVPHPKIIEKELEEYKRTDYISVPSIFVKKTFLDEGIPEEKIIHVPYGVNLSAFKQVPKTDGVFRIVFVGGMCLRKGVHYLLQAFAELNLPNSELMLLGAMNEEMEPFFKKYKGYYNYVGKIPQAELYKYYSQGSVFVMMSIEEGLALVQPQAMACGLPIIATTNTGAEDIIRDGKDGFIIPIRNVEALKEKIKYLYEHQDICRAMGISAKERVSQGFSWDDYGNKMIAEYKRILNLKNNDA